MNNILCRLLLLFLCVQKIPAGVEKWTDVELMCLLDKYIEQVPDHNIRLHDKDDNEEEEDNDDYDDDGDDDGDTEKRWWFRFHIASQVK